MFLGQDRRPRLIWRILLAWLGFFGCVLIIGVTTQAATARLAPVISHAVAGLGITASALGLVLLLRRHADRRPWSGIGLTLDRAAIPRLMNRHRDRGHCHHSRHCSHRATRARCWGPSADATTSLAEHGLATTIIMIAISTLLVQGFPEVLVFRGYMFRNLGETLPLWVTVASSSLIFGLMHVLSNNEAVLGVLIAGAALTIAVRQWRAPLDWRAVPGDA